MPGLSFRTVDEYKHHIGLLLGENRTLIETLVKILNSTWFKPGFLWPHTSVPACLSGAAAWAGLGKDGINLNLHPAVPFSIGTVVGGASGLWSFFSSYSNRQSLKSKTLEKLADLKDALDALELQSNEENLNLQDYDQIYLKLKRINDLLSTSNLNPTLNPQQQHNTAFGVFTSTITSFVYTSLGFFEREDLKLIFGTLVAVAAFGSEMYLADRGQKDQVMFTSIKNATNAAHTIISDMPTSAADTAIDLEDALAAGVSDHGTQGNLDGAPTPTTPLLYAAPNLTSPTQGFGLHDHRTGQGEEIIDLQADLAQAAAERATQTGLGYQTP